MSIKRKVPFGTITITDKARQLVNQALESRSVSQGRLVREFEKRFAEIVGVKEAVAVSSGTDADMLALATLYDFGAESGDEVIIPAISFIATANSVVHAGFNPVFVDVKRETYNINQDLIEERITNKTKAIMPVHLMGKLAEMDAIADIAKKHNLYVIEDAAEAHGAKYKGRNAGSIGDMAAFSLYVAHIISSIEGGIITTNNEQFTEILRSLRTHGRGCTCKECILNIKPSSSTYCEKRFRNGIDTRFSFERIGYSSKMNELEAAVGLGTLDEYDKILTKRKENLDYLMNKFRIFEPVLQTFKQESHEIIGPHAFPIILGERARFGRDEYAQSLEKNGIETRVFFSSMPTQCPSFSYLGYRMGDFPEAEYLGNNGLHVGVHQDLCKEDLDYVIEVTERFVREKTG